MNSDGRSWISGQRPLRAEYNTRFQVELASIEHPRLLAAALDESRKRSVSIGRVSQGGGLRMLTEDELKEMLDLAHTNGIEVFLFVSSRNSFEPLADRTAGDQLRGEEAFADAVGELHRCAALGVDGVLVADVGLLWVAGEMARRDELGGLRLKTSAAIAPRNAAGAALYEQLGATSINVAGSSTLDDLIAMRKRLAPETTIDVYVEEPSDLGGGLRYAAALYPYGAHLEPVAEQTIREKVRRAELALSILAAHKAELVNFPA